jgi:2-amino-4-hydroxy-6-hydroxymethyldihydropteridine diphosphokinase
MPVQVYIGLGSNLDNPETHIHTALAELRCLALDDVVVGSPLYITSPVGPPDQPDYVNAVAGFATRLAAHELLNGILGIEQKHGRQRAGNQWGPRTLDLDLLLYGEDVIQTEVLTVPHPRIKERAFVLKPLADIAPDLKIPGQGRVQDLLDGCDQSGIKRQVADAE